MGAFTHNCRDIRPRALIVPVGLLCDGMLPTDFSLFISFTTGLRAYIHTFMTIFPKRCLPQPAKHYIQYSLLACHIIMILASLPASCFGPLSGD